ncbi:hypothetical protein [Desulfitobacterium sp. AusDCA]|uniref:hypothetical protein n=1 Tax=Desulfitobacterium sp. AusDCA TaxID=3240383 RepID=UPI003DA748AF
MESKTPQALWQDYRFLTKEMLKFFSTQDMDLFYELLNQRGSLQTIIEQTADDGFKDSIAGQNLLAEIKMDNENITNNLQHRLMRLQRNHQVTEVYNSKNSPSNNRMNWNV